eukprot:CAMPEP_0117421818 /NCGR_PEP_ID=MMETSP0758-20121206/2797_1 /TAXON_ID=63605 /ORGANISM="Percolomonas cosmopolitus, Strain AE-1 (ATCC 50343)" /LENGTH=620 /DNA_ID=CAMNT_0005204097 /DNA_START=391 /DNA_END=2250 /DNA_ORIENTATION=+
MQLNKPVLSAIAMTKHGLYRYWKQTTVNNSFIEGKFELEKGETLTHLVASPTSNLILTATQSNQLYQIECLHQSMALSKISYVRRNEYDSPYDYQSLSDVSLAVETTSTLMDSVYSWISSWGSSGPKHVYASDHQHASCIKKLFLLKTHLYVLRSTSFERWSLQPQSHANVSSLWIQDFSYDIHGLETDKGKTSVIDMHCAMQDDTERITILVSQTSRTLSTSDVPLMTYKLFQFEYTPRDDAMDDDELLPTLRLHHSFGTYARDFHSKALERSRVFAHHQTFYILSPTHLLISESPFDSHLTHDINDMSSIVMGGFIDGSMYVVSEKQGLVKAITSSSQQCILSKKPLVSKTLPLFKQPSSSSSSSTMTNLSKKDKVLRAFHESLQSDSVPMTDLLDCLPSIVDCSTYIANLTHFYALHWVSPSLVEHPQMRMVITQLLQEKAKLHALFIDFLRRHSLFEKLSVDDRSLVLLHGELIEVALAIRQAQNPRCWTLTVPLDAEELIGSLSASAIELSFKDASSFETPSAERVFSRVTSIDALLPRLFEASESLNNPYATWFVLFTMSKVIDRVLSYRQRFEHVYMISSNLSPPLDYSEEDPAKAIPLFLTHFYSRFLSTSW